MQITNYHVSIAFFSKQNKALGHVFEFYVPEILEIDAVISTDKNNKTLTGEGKVACVDNDIHVKTRWDRTLVRLAFV